MGYYINSVPTGNLPTHNKAKFLLENVMGTVVVSSPKTETDFVENLVCVVENRFFDAAAYCFSSQEMMTFARPDGRPKYWLIVPDAKNLAK